MPYAKNMTAIKRLIVYYTIWRFVNYFGNKIFNITSKLYYDQILIHLCDDLRE